MIRQPLCDICCSICVCFMHACERKRMSERVCIRVCVFVRAWWGVLFGFRPQFFPTRTHKHTHTQPFPLSFALSPDLCLSLTHTHRCRFLQAYKTGTATHCNTLQHTATQVKSPVNELRNDEACHTDAVSCKQTRQGWR